MVSSNKYLTTLLTALDDIQASEIVTIDVKDQTTVTDFMVICNGRSSRHVKAIAETAMEKLKENGLSSISATGFDTGDWILVDFGDLVLHVMQAETRAFYNIEGLWQSS